MRAALLLLFLARAAIAGEDMPGMDMELVPESRNASGTAWQPDATPMYGAEYMLGEWMLMVHGNAFLGYDAQGGPRGGEKLIATGWGMLMAQHDLAGGAFSARVMLSPEPLTVGKSGYPLLLQSGETYSGRPLRDRQHPHDLFMELAAMYTRPLTSWLGIQLYAAPAGEPALGPVAFPHRISSLADPLAVIGHHWQDSTHISFGVLTAGLFTRYAKLEGSWFNGREPDENRWNLDLRALDSYSGRLSFNPAESFSFQASYGYLASPEALRPDESVRRFTVSGTHDVRLPGGSNLATTAVFGRNMPDLDPATNSWLLESELNVQDRHLIAARFELVQKLGEELVVPGAQARYDVATLVLGFSESLGGQLGGTVPSIGVRGSINFVPAELSALYGSSTPLGVMVFVQLRPAEMKPMTMQ
jgi:hypothetical protein